MSIRLDRSNQEFGRHRMPSALVDCFPHHLWSVSPVVAVDYLTMPPTELSIDELADIAWGFYAEGVSRAETDPYESRQMLRASKLLITEARSWGVEI